MESARSNKGAALIKLCKYEEAIVACNEEIKINPNKEKALNNKGAALYKLGKYDEALVALEDALKIKPKYEYALKNKGISLYGLGKTEEALKMCELAIEINPEYVEAWINKGSFLKALKRYQEALEAFESALKLDPKSDEAKIIKKECEALLENSKQNNSNILANFEEINDYQKCPLIKNDDLRDSSFINSIFGNKNIRIIGKGGFGKVFFGVSKNGAQNIAVKVIESFSLDDHKESLNELSNLEKLGGHPNIMTFLKYHIHHSKTIPSCFQIFIEMPLAKCSLEYIINKRTRLTEGEIMYILSQLSLGLEHAHKVNLVHMDLKPENILIVSDDFKIADWGGSLRMKSSSSTLIKSEISGTWGYFAPEFEDVNYCAQNRINFYLGDIYSLGMVLLRMCGINIETIRKIPKGMKVYHDLCLEQKVFPELKKYSYSKSLTDILFKMIQFTPNERIRLRDLISALASE